MGRSVTFSVEPPSGSTQATNHTLVSATPQATDNRGRRGPQTRAHMHAEAAAKLEPLEQAAARQAAHKQAGKPMAVVDEVKASHEASRGPALR